MRWVCSGRNGKGADSCPNKTVVDEEELIQVLQEYFHRVLQQKNKVIDYVVKEFQRVYKAKDENAEYEKELKMCIRDRILSAFEGMWFDIPTPFESGDILCKGHFYSETEEAKREEMEPFILCRINTWNTDKKRNFLLQDGDITDMGFSAFYLEKDRCV